MTGAGAGPAERAARSGRRFRRRPRWAAAITVGALIAALVACGPAPSPVASPTPTASPSPTPLAADAGRPTLRFALSGDPSSLLPPAGDADSRRVQAFLYDALYRLDDALRPVPVLAADMPGVSKDGKTWTVPVREGVTFSDGSPLDAGDVATTLRLARSVACPFGDACDAARERLSDVKVDEQAVVLTLARPWSPLLATLLVELPILPADGLEASLERLRASAADLDTAALGQAIDRIEAAVNAVECDVAAPPAGCSPADHEAELRDWLRRAGAAEPLPERFTDMAGEVDRVAYGGALLAAVDALSEVLGRPDAPATPKPSPGATSAAIDRLARALPLLDLARQPVGTGPYRLVSYRPGERIVLERREAGALGEPTRVEAIVLRDPVEAATALQSGDIDWLPSVAPEMVPVLESDASLIVGARPSGAERVIVFNVREGQPYADPVASQAFARCLDRDALVSATLAERGLPADTLVAPASWAAWSPKPQPADPAAARELLEAAGYTEGPDGTYVRDGQRLASDVIIRPGRAELSALMSAVAEGLEACGIDLTVREVPFSPDVILPQLEWPNTFSTYLATTALGPDPAVDLAWLDGDRVTTKANPGDANFGGWQDKATDELLATGLATLDMERRRTAYRDLQARLADLVPAWPLVHEAAYAAVSGHLERGGERVDPGQAAYESGLREWRLALP